MQQFGSVADLAHAVGVSDNAIYKWVSGRGQPSMGSLVILANAAGVSVEWLVTGHGLTKTRAEIPTEDNSEFVNLPRNTIRTADGKGTFESPQIVNPLKLRSVWVKRALGADPKSLALVEVVGDSMAPTVNETDFVLTDLRQRHFEHDGIYVLRINRVLAVKRVQRQPDGLLSVRSDNPSYEAFSVKPESLAVFGRVLWIGRRV